MIKWLVIPVPKNSDHHVMLTVEMHNGSSGSNVQINVICLIWLQQRMCTIFHCNNCLESTCILLLCLWAQKWQQLFRLFQLNIICGVLIGWSCLCDWQPGSLYCFAGTSASEYTGEKDPHTPAKKKLGLHSEVDFCDRLIINNNKSFYEAQTPVHRLF